VEQIPFGDISLVVQTLPASYVDKLLTFIGSELDVTSHIEFYLTWSFHILNIHGKYLKVYIS
jgi:periodic tryptophan protein 2